MMSLGTGFTEWRRRYLRRVVAVGTVAALCGCAGAAWSQRASSPTAQALRQACATDYHALCSGVQAGGGRIIACFEQNETKLSEQCRSAMLAAKATKQQAN
jgi:hypothetical protein